MELLRRPLTDTCSHLYNRLFIVNNVTSPLLTFASWGCAHFKGWGVGIGQACQPDTDTKRTEPKQRENFWNLDRILSVITHRPSEFYFGSKQIARQTSTRFVPIFSSPLHVSFLVPLVGCGTSFSTVVSILCYKPIYKIYNLTGYIQYGKKTYLWSGFPLEWRYF